MIVVLGTARSGTSLTAGVIAALGFDPGAELIPPDATNPKGHFEDLPLWKLTWVERAPRADVEQRGNQVNQLILYLVMHAGIDNGGLAGALALQHRTVLLVGRHRHDADFDRHA